jgi:FMN phosphatase YigB (HAD superfamily)
VGPAQTAYFLDFDHTIFDTDGFFHVDVRNSFLRLGIDATDWEHSYAAVWPTGYELEKHVEEVSRRCGRRWPLEEMKRILQNSFSDLRRYLFPDVLPFLRRAKSNGARLHLLSFGSREWQRYKILAADVSPYFHDVFFTATEGGKAQLVEQQGRSAARRVVVVDNNPGELDLIKDLAPEVRTYCMNRVPDEMRCPADELSRLKFLEARRYLERTPRHPHIPCRSLDGML